MLDGFDEIKVCVGYKLDGKRIDRLPAGADAQARVEPIYETFEGWSEIDARRALAGPTCRRRRSSTSAASRS